MIAPLFSCEQTLHLIYLHAAKFEEHEDHMVCMEQLQVMAQQYGENPENYTKQEFLTMELYLLKFFEWSVSHPTAVHFAEYFLSVEDMEIEEEDPVTSHFTPSATLPCSKLDGSEMRAQVDRLTSCFLEASLRGDVTIIPLLSLSACMHTNTHCTCVHVVCMHHHGENM